jgi:uncharacterized protein with PIN domain
MAYTVTLRFYEELNDFISDYPPKEDIPFTFRDRRSVKDLIESLGVPHVEVDLILVHGRSVDFDYIVQDGDRISIYPVFERLDITGLTHLRAAPLRQTRFVLDVHLGSLTRKLRLLGFDCDYSNDRDDPELAAISAQQQRVLLTRDRGLLKRKIVSRGLIIRHDDPDEQLAEVLNRLDLKGQIRPFARCIECNSLLAFLPRKSPLFEELKSSIPMGILERYREFSCCPSCRKVFWKGSHYDAMMKELYESGLIPAEPET